MTPREQLAFAAGTIETRDDAANLDQQAAAAALRSLAEGPNLAASEPTTEGDP